MKKNLIVKETKEVVKTLWSFKWSIFFYWLLAYFPFIEYFYPPQKDDPIFKAEAIQGDWSYLNYDVYHGTTKLYCVIVILFFLLATSNMKNHPKLARFILLCPWIIIIFGLVKELFLFLLF